MTYRCEGCGKTSRIAPHEAGCPVVMMRPPGLDDAVAIFNRWRPGHHGPSLALHRDDVVAMEALWDEINSAQRTRMHLRGGGTLDVCELFDTLAVSDWWERSWPTQ